MQLKTFKGGVHPQDQKHWTNKVSVTLHIAEGEVIIPLRQHIGAPCEPLVAVGDTVKMGQKIGESKSFVSAPVHSSVSGTVTAIKPHPHPGGGEEMCIFIENDGKDTLAEGIKNWDLELTPNKMKEYLKTISPKTVVDKVREAGITGMGGAAFPTHVKLSPPPEVNISTIVINGAECEPYLTADHREMLENAQKIVLGAKMIKKAVSAVEVIIAIENNKPDAIEAMKQVCKDFSDVKVGVLKTKYPQGSEKQLIQAITKKQVPSGALPSAVGIIVNNIDTCVAVAEAVVRNMPLIERVVTVSGDAVKNPSNLRTRIGVPFYKLIESAGGFIGDPKKVVMGGPMMGIAQNNLNAPVIKGTSGILAFKEPQTYGKEEGACIKCSKCVQVCPMRLMPNYLSVFAEAKNVDKLLEHHIMDCMECGSCAFICPQRRFMVQHIKAGKSLVKEQQAKKG